MHSNIHTYIFFFLLFYTNKVQNVKQKRHTNMRSEIKSVRNTDKMSLNSMLLQLY